MKKSKAGRGKSVAKRKAAKPRAKSARRASRPVARSKAVKKAAAKKTVRRKAPPKPRPQYTYGECRMKINGAWEEKANSKNICRWFVAWSNVGKSEIAGAVAGYAGGGSFVVERFYGTLSEFGGNLTSLWIDYTDSITGDEINFNDCGEEAIRITEAGLDAVWEWNDNSVWNDTDEVILMASRLGELKSIEDMHFLAAERLPCLSVICEKAGLTAAPK